MGDLQAPSILRSPIVRRRPARCPWRSSSFEPQRSNAVANATVSPAVTSSSAISKVPSPFSCQSKNGGNVSQ